MDPTLTSEPVANPDPTAKKGPTVSEDPIVTKLLADLRIVLRDLFRASPGISDAGAEGSDSWPA